MKQLADGLYMLSGFPPNAINVYLMGDVLVDAGTRHSGRRIFRQLDGHAGRRARAHPRPSGPPGREQGGLREARHPAVVRRARRRRDGERRLRPEGPLDQPVITRAWAGPPHPVARRCARATRWPASGCSTCPGTRPATSPTGASPTASLIAGDVLNNMNVHDRASPGCTSRTRSSRPTRRCNRESARRLAALEPALVCFGHGPPLRDPRKLVEFVESAAALTDGRAASASSGSASWARAWPRTSRRAASSWRSGTAPPRRRDGGPPSTARRSPPRRRRWRRAATS